MTDLLAVWDLNFKNTSLHIDNVRKTTWPSWQMTCFALHSKIKGRFWIVLGVWVLCCASAPAGILFGFLVLMHIGSPRAPACKYWCKRKVLDSGPCITWDSEAVTCSRLFRVLWFHLLQSLSVSHTCHINQKETIYTTCIFFIMHDWSLVTSISNLHQWGQTKVERCYSSYPHG